ncbi:MAG: hypothetical protein ACLTWO_12095 [Blautia massiliensis (ex Durand et al. 2017)]
MKHGTDLLAALLAAGLAGCGAAPQAPASAAPASETSIEQQAAAAYDAYRPEPGSAAAFQDADGFWYAVYPKTLLDSREDAAALFPDAVIPAAVGDFAFTGFSPYDSGFSAAGTFEVAHILQTDTAALDGAAEGLIPLPASCGREQYGVRYQSAAGGVLVLTVDRGETLAEDKTLTASDYGGRTFYTRPNQPHTLGVQVEYGPALWLSSVFPDAYTPYTEDDPRAELSGEELAALLTEVSGAFSAARDPAALYHGGAERTPEEVLARALEDAVPPACPDCGAVTAAELTASEELPVQQRDCIAMAQGTDAVYDLLLTYDWVCPACGYRDAGHTVTGNRVIVCHGWMS